MSDNTTSKADINAQRRKKYREDLEFRRTVMKRRRERYRKNEAGHIRNAAINIEHMDQFGKIRTLITSPGEGESEDILCFTNNELAKALGYHYISLYRWQGKGKFPKPWVSVKDRQLKVYTCNQVRSILSTMGEHQKHSQYLRGADSTTISQLMDAVKTV